MNIQEWMTRKAAAANAQAALDLDGRCAPVRVNGWVISGERASASVTFGP